MLVHLLKHRIAKCGVKLSLGLRLCPGRRDLDHVTVRILGIAIVQGDAFQAEPLGSFRRRLQIGLSFIDPPIKSAFIIGNVELARLLCRHYGDGQNQARTGDNRGRDVAAAECRSRRIQARSGDMARYPD